MILQEVNTMTRYLITGATGYIGSSFINRILRTAETSDVADSIQVTALVRDVDKARAMLPESVRFLSADIADVNAMSRIEGNFGYIVHCAAPTRSAYMISHPVETTDSIVLGTKNVLELARRCHAKSVVYLSSMEVYGDVDCSDGRRVTEEELGAVSLFDARSCYPMGKRMAENLCYSYYKECGVPVKIARLAQTFGAGILPGENRVFAQFAESARTGTDIVLHTAGTSVGNYCDIDDVIDALLLLLEKGQDGEAYNVVNEDNTMMIREMAQLVADKIAGGSIHVVYDIPEGNAFGYAAPTGLRLSGKKLEALAWKARTGLEEMYRNMMK